MGYVVFFAFGGTTKAVLLTRTGEAVQAIGVTPVAAARVAASAPTCLPGSQHRTGAFEPGKYADFVVLDGTCVRRR